MTRTAKNLIKLTSFGSVLLSAVLLMLNYSTFAVVIVVLSTAVFWLILRYYFDDPRYYMSRKDGIDKVKKKLSSIDVFLGICVFVAFLALLLRFTSLGGDDTRENVGSVIGFCAMFSSILALLLARYDFKNKIK